jgi:probable HAF family extracellular repeat protein
MRRISILLLVFCTCFCMAAWPQAKNQFPTYTVVDLGTFGGTFSIAGGLSNSGWVEGYATLPGDTVSHAYLWKQGRMMDLGNLGADSYAYYRPNNSGDAGGSVETTVPDPNGEDFCQSGTYLTCLPFFWQNGNMTTLPTLGGTNGRGYQVNDQKMIAGTAENTTPEPTCIGTGQIFQYEPVVWQNGNISPLPTYPGDPIGEAYAVNNKGQIAGYSGVCFQQNHALLWQNGVATDLGNLGLALGTYATDINNKTQIVGSSRTADGSVHAFLWQRGVMSDLGTIPGDAWSEALGINSKGQVVGGTFDDQHNFIRAFLWQNGLMVDLNTLIPPDSPMYLLIASGTINDAGQIAGFGVVLSTGEVHAFLLNPTGHEVTVRPGQFKQGPRVVTPETTRKMTRMMRRSPDFK